MHSAYDAGGTECQGRLSFNRRRKAWSLRDWAGLYRDSPSRQSKLQVADRCVRGGRRGGIWCRNGPVEGATYLSVPERHILTPHRHYFSPLHCRTAITTEDAERRCVSPAGLQAAIDRVVADFPAGSRRVQLLGGGARGGGFSGQRGGYSRQRGEDTGGSRSGLSAFDQGWRP